MKAFRITANESHDPRGPDGKGWNRLSIIPLTPSDRCMLRPKTRQAALDTARGMARFAPFVMYENCIGESCDSCRIGGKEREEFKPDWLLIEDDQRGGVWLHAGLEKDSFGYYYKSWEMLTRSIDLPPLRRMHDKHWGAYFMAKKDQTEAV